MQNKSSYTTRNLIYTALFAAIICLFTTVFKFNIGLANGYYHIGDTFIFVAAVLLPFPFSAFAGAIGSMLADLLSGFPIYIIPTFIIKFMMTLPFTSKTEKILNIKNYFALLISSIILVAGYYITEVFILQLNFKAAAASLPGNILQAVLNSVFFVLLAYAIDKRFDFKNFIKK